MLTCRPTCSLTPTTIMPVQTCTGPRMRGYAATMDDALLRFVAGNSGPGFPLNPANRLQVAQGGGCPGRLRIVGHGEVPCDLHAGHAGRCRATLWWDAEPPAD
jgi:hypothetical protein